MFTHSEILLIDDILPVKSVCFFQQGSFAVGSNWADPNYDDIQGDIDTGRDAIRAQCGLYPNVMILSPSAFNGIRNNKVVKDNFKYTTSQSITADMIAGYFNVDKVYVAKAIFVDAASNAIADVWGNDVVMGYVPQQSLSQEEPSFGYTYTLQGNPAVEVPYYDNNSKSWVYGVTNEYCPVIAGITAGYLMKNVGAKA